MLDNPEVDDISIRRKPKNDVTISAYFLQMVTFLEFKVLSFTEGQPI